MPEVAEAPTKSPFAAALEKAFQSVEPEASTEAAPTPKQESEKPPKKEASPEPNTPRELFKKQAADKTKVDDSDIGIAEPAKLDAKGKAGWEAAKQEIRTWRSKAMDLEKSIAERKAAGKDPEALEAKLAEHEAKLQEYDGIVARARMEDHPDYRREFIDGRSKLITKAQTIIEESGGDSKAVELALNLKGKPRVDALREVAGELDNFQSARLGRVIDELTDLDERAEAKRSEAKKSYEEMQEQDRQREIEGRTNKFKNKLTEFDDTTRRLRGELEVLQKVDGNDGWSAQADTIVREARAAVEANPDLNIESELLSRALPVYRNLFMQADAKVIEHEAKIAELEKELKSIHGKSPSLAARGGNAAPAGDNRRPFSTALASDFGE